MRRISLLRLQNSGQAKRFPWRVKLCRRMQQGGVKSNCPHPLCIRMTSPLWLLSCYPSLFGSLRSIALLGSSFRQWNERMVQWTEPET